MTAGRPPSRTISTSSPSARSSSAVASALASTCAWSKASRRHAGDAGQGLEVGAQAGHEAARRWSRGRRSGRRSARRQSRPATPSPAPARRRSACDAGDAAARHTVGPCSDAARPPNDQQAQRSSARPRGRQEPAHAQAARPGGGPQASARRHRPQGGPRARQGASAARPSSSSAQAMVTGDDAAPARPRQGPGAALHPRLRRRPVEPRRVHAAGHGPRAGAVVRAHPLGVR